MKQKYTTLDFGFGYTNVKAHMNKFILLFFLSNIVLFQLYSQTNTLFSSDSTLKITIKYNSDKVFKDRDENSKYHLATLQLQVDSSISQLFNIELKTRGIFRLKKANCYFPPFLIKFNKNETTGTLFDGNTKLKLVIPCNKSNSYEQYVLLEYLSYKIYNQLTDISFRVRLLKIKLIDLDGKRPVFDKYGFFIEPSKLLAERTNSKEIKVKNLHPDLTDYQLINLMSLFQYMIGNTDWSVKALHNIILLSRDSLKSPVAVPYDFDFSGLVNAQYASPAEHLNISSVRVRYYNGYFREMDELLKNILLFKKKKDVIYKVIQSTEGLEKHYIDETIKYFDQFYEILDDHDRIKQEFIEKCRKD